KLDRSKCSWIGFRQLTAVPLGGAFQGFYCFGFVEVDHDVELRRQSYLEVMAETLRLRSVNHANGTLQSLLLQQVVSTIALAQIRVVRPDRNFGPAAIEVTKQLTQCFEHVLVAQVP